MKRKMAWRLDLLCISGSFFDVCAIMSQLEYGCCLHPTKKIVEMLSIYYIRFHAVQVCNFI